MGTYHQMGHYSENLLNDSELGQFCGAILSPVNYNEQAIASQVSTTREHENWETIFDPQLYYPKSERGLLRDWDYFPSGADTSDIQSDTWWKNVTEKIVASISRIRPNASCSPAFAPRSFTNDYYSMIIDIGNHFCGSLANSGIQPIQTVLAGMADLSTPKRALEVSSIVSRTSTTSVYLVLVSDIPPRREFSDVEGLKGSMRLISALVDSGLNVIIGFCSSDMILWKAAGASSCATGKYFNLRRFTSSRFEEPAEGGGQLPYWFEESLIAFLRESDIIRVKKAGKISQANIANPFSRQIFDCIENDQGNPWLGLSWRHYMYSFADLEYRIHKNDVDIPLLLKTAENTWLHLEDNGVLMEEIRNNGEWIRAWRRALIEYKSF